MFWVDSKRRNTVIPTALTYTSSQNMFHDITNNGNDYGSIIARKINRPCNLEAIPITNSWVLSCYFAVGPGQTVVFSF